MSRDRVFLAALIFSLMFHLSMVTLFRIVLYFPRENIEYLRFSIVHTPADTDIELAEEAEEAEPDLLPVPGQQRLQGASPDEAFERARAAEAPLAERLGASLPPIALPAVPFAEQDLLRARTQSLDIRARYEELFASEPQDTWGRFSRRLGQLGDQLQRLALGGEEEERLIPVSRPAPGFEAYLEWLEPPVDRSVLSAGKVDALWGYDPARLQRPIVLVFRVNREGRVVFVLPPVEDRDGIVASAVQALLQYRFEPLGDDALDQHNGTLIVQAASENAP